MAEWLECWTRNPEAPNSSPAPGFVLGSAEFKSLATP